MECWIVQGVVVQGCKLEHVHRKLDIRRQGEEYQYYTQSVSVNEAK
jgi:hypothetical protein